ncbi:hypothetical protein Cgig2_016676 [Carnegiea gigantea]|uniref:Uncharacterized protein n=1 Tax=Carnegiea gigantea TaxID=171969 RepID=A0A9Q1KZV1_9CARY|nr:hypothetical protein Cgig2_016676 [Carnegiea gigantea]
MAPPHSEAVVTSFPMAPKNVSKRPPRLSNNNLKRTISDIAFELHKEIDRERADSKALPPISEAEDAKCECCGMSEEYTPGYIKRVREQFCGKWICGLCSEAVKEEMEKNGGNSAAMREILKKSSRIRAKSMSPRDLKGPRKGGITRSSSCIPAITKEISDLKTTN